MPSAELVAGVVSAFGGLAAAGAAWWAARVALRIARKDRETNAAWDSRAEAWNVFNVRIEKLLALMTVAERAAQEGGAWVIGEGRKTDPKFLHDRSPARAESDGVATAELRARLLLTREYLPLTRALLLEGMPFSAGDASAPFEALQEEFDGDNQWWLELAMNDVDPIGLQVVRAEILLTVRGLERAAETVAASTAGDASELSGWELAFKPLPARLRGDEA